MSAGQIASAPAVGRLRRATAGRRAHDRLAFSLRPSRPQCAMAEASRSAPIEPLSRRAAATSCRTHSHGSPRQRARRARNRPVGTGRRRRGMPERSAGPPRTEAGCEGWEGWAKTGGTGRTVAPRASVWPGRAPGPWRPRSDRPRLDREGSDRPRNPAAAFAGPVFRKPGNGHRGRYSAVATACSLVSAMTASSLDTTGWIGLWVLQRCGICDLWASSPPV
jgi:hypothetical protein